MSLKPELIEELSIQIAENFTKGDLDGIMVTTTGKGLFEAWTGEKDSVRKTAFDLMQEVRRQGVEQSVLAAMLARRPQNDALRKVIGDACPEALQAMPTTRQQVAVLITGLDALRARLDDPAVRERLERSVAGLGQIAATIDKLYIYKSLHECLHQLQAKQFRTLREAAETLPTDIEHATELLAYRNQLRSACLIARDVVDRLPPMPAELRATEMAWIDVLEAVGEQFHTAIENSDSDNAHSALRTIRSIMGTEPPRLNGLIVTTSAVLPLDDLTQALTDIGGDAVPEITAALASLQTIIPTLHARVTEHRAWQAIELCIADLDRVFEDKKDADLIKEFGRQWRALKPQVQDLAARDPDAKWSIKILDCVTKVDDRAAAEQADDAFRFAFDVWRGESQFRFLMVDSKLRADCSELVRIGNPLHRILEELAP